MNFKTAYEYLIKSYGSGQKKGLPLVLQALLYMGNPQESLNIIHVAGTNGKGSICAMLASILKSEGYKTGQFSSPHLEVINERFSINGEPISQKDFARHMQRIADISYKVLNDGTFSYFEILTLLAFSYFNEQKVDYLLLEVGIGGRLDATNVIKKPIVSIITAIDMDHMDILGDTLEKIAYEKGGIIKSNCPVVMSNNKETVYNVIKTIAKEKCSSIYFAEQIEAINIKSDLKNTCFAVNSKFYNNIKIKLNLLGQYQIENAQTALMTCYVLNSLGHKIGIKSILQGFKNVSWHGRMEVISHNPLIILEGAHNVQGAKMAAEFLKSIDIKTTLVIGMLLDKEYTKIVNILAGAVDVIIFTKPNYDFKAVSPTQLALTLKHDNTYFIEHDHKNALKLAQKITDNDGLIFCTGSLYLIGDIRQTLKNKGFNKI